MKKFRILMGVLALVMVAAIIIACTKEKEKGIAQISSEIETVSKEDDMSAYLKQFKEKMQSATKGDETLSMEDARWHLEAVLNYTYGDAGRHTTDIQCDTFHYTLLADGNEVTLFHLNQAFNAISNDVEKAYGNCNLPDKSIIAIQTLFENDIKSDEGVVVRSVVSTRGFRPINMWFDSTDYWGEWYCDYGWGWISSSGKCGPYEGEHPESGAPLELTRKLNLRIPAYGCFQGTGYYTDLCVVNVSLNTFDNIDINFLYDENSPCDYKLYYRNEDPSEPWASNPERCICPEDMNYYLSKGPELLNYYKPVGKVVVDAYYYSAEILGAKASNCFHELVVTYGDFHCNTNGGGVED